MTHQITRKTIYLWVFSLLLLFNSFAALAQLDILTWGFQAPIAFTGEPETPSIFLNVAADADGHVFVANLMSVLIFDAETGTLEGAIQDASGTIRQYDDVAPGDDGSVWVANSKTFTVYHLDADGTILTAIPAEAAETASAEISPNEIDIGPDGNLYVLFSSANTQMQVFTQEGEFLRSFTMGDRSLSSGVIDFAFAPDGNIYVAGGGTVRVLDTEGTVVVNNFAEEFIASKSMGVRGVAVDADGNVYIGGNYYAENGTDLAGAVFKLDTDGQFLAYFGKAQQRMDWGSEFKTEELGFTLSLAVLPDGHVIISDSNSAFSQLLNVQSWLK